MSLIRLATCFRCGFIGLVGLVWATTASAQLQITEVLFDSLSSEPRWEWIEVRNSGAMGVDLNGYVLDDDDGNIVLSSNISNASQSTLIPAGGIAVLYNVDQNSDAQLFRDAWQLDGGVQLIGVTTPPGLNNSGGDHFGFWPSYTDYLADSVDDGEGNLVVGGFGNAPTNLNYNMFPGGGGASTAWNGTGNYQDGANWGASMAGTGGAVASVEVGIMDAINRIDDTGNPGIVPAGPQASGLLISEIMYNPRSDEPGWEWVEVVNNTGQNIDFASGGYYLDDIAGGALQNPNITSGAIADGEVAILYDDSIDPADFTAAWGAVNAIPVSSFSALNNGGDTVAIWDDDTAYSTDRMNGDFANAAVSVAYDDDGTDWPFDDGMSSIYLTDLSADAAVGTNWIISFNGDGISFNASAVGGTVIEHVGGDVGSPGFVPDGSDPIIDADFNDDMVIDGADIDLLTMDVANGTNDVAMFDLNGDGDVDYDDVVQWLADAGEANLPSMNSYLVGDANLDGTVDGQDFVVWNGSKFTVTGRWTEGDFNADGNTDGQDFIAWNSAKFTSADTHLVPEPQLAGFASLILLGLLCRRF